MIRTGELTERVLRHFGCAGENYGTMQKYVGMTQLRTDSGWDVTTADVVVMGAWGSTAHDIQGFEVKVSRSDWLNEVKKPNKNDSIKQYCDRFWLVITSEDMVKEGELPDSWGMMVVSGAGLKIVKKAPKLEPIPLTKSFVAMMMRSNQSDTIPLDVHSDHMKDLERKYNAEYKEKYSGLIKFIKEINKELGVEVKYDDYSKSWYSNIGNWELRKEMAKGNIYLTPQELGEIIKFVLKGEMTELRWSLKGAAQAAKTILESTKPFLEEDDK